MLSGEQVQTSSYTVSHRTLCRNACRVAHTHAHRSLRIDGKQASKKKKTETKKTSTLNSSLFGWMIYPHSVGTGFSVCSARKERVRVHIFIAATEHTLPDKNSNTTVIGKLNKSLSPREWNKYTAVALWWQNVQWWSRKTTTTTTIAHNKIRSTSNLKWARIKTTAKPAQCWDRARATALCERNPELTYKYQ